MQDTLNYLFSWPTGGVWSNLIASAIWAIPSLFVVLRKMKKHHIEKMTKLDAIHADVRANRETL